MATDMAMDTDTATENTERNNFQEIFRHYLPTNNAGFPFPAIIPGYGETGVSDTKMPLQQTYVYRSGKFYSNTL